MKLYLLGAALPAPLSLHLHCHAPRNLLASAAILVCGMPGVALAQQAAGAASQQLDSVVITATRSPTALTDAPAAVTLVTEKEIERTNASRVGDALSRVPSLYLESPAQGQSHTSSGAGGFSLRGMDTKRSLVLLDGQPLQNANSLGLDWRTVFMDDVARIEVVPGAFSSLFGSSAIGGVINVISKTPDRREITARVKRGTGDAAGTDGSFYFRDRFANGLGVVFGVGYQDREGYVSDYVMRQPVTGAPGTPVAGAIATPNRQGVASYLVGDKGASPWRQGNAVLKLAYDINADHHLTLGATASNFTAGWGPFNTYLTNAAGQPVSSGTLGINGQRVTLSETNFVTSTPLEENSRRIFASYDGRLSPAMSLRADLARIKRESFFTTAGTSANWAGGTGTLSDTPNTGTDATLQVTADVWSGHQFVAGLAFHEDAVERRTYTLANWRDSDGRGTNTNGYDAKSSTKSAFLQDEITVSQAVTVYAGARLDRWTTSGRYFQTTAPVTNTDFPSRSATKVSPKLSAVFKPTGDVTLRASVGSSFRAPSNLDLYSNTVIASSTSPTGFLTSQSDPNLKPERGEGAEVGGEWRVNPALKLGATLHRTRISNLIYTKNVDLSLNQRVNAGSATVQGLELVAAAQPLSWLTIDASYAYIDSEITANDADPSSVGKRLTVAPANIGSLGATALLGPWSANIGWRHSGKAYTTANNSDVVQGVPQSKDSYQMVHAKAGYRFNPMWQFNLAVNNLLDTKAYDFYRLPGRNFTFEVVGRF